MVKAPNSRWDPKHRETNILICESAFYRRLTQVKICAQAILLQYIPNMKELKWTEYEERRRQNFAGGLNAIYDALVFFDDLYPRDMMVVDGNLERKHDFETEQFDNTRQYYRRPRNTGMAELMT
ncbi:hypothetical protein I7I51_06277 [Histoplasma capsulatum]|uniref:Uncharacterized protein n=1 Tax=Ajellomyces capsulatus TaxID=5037 RepID=A0A8A1ML97_AJECA|nr:hypothetical protein I7I51_06277 [Histoplasma capsulatum]